MDSTQIGFINNNHLAEALIDWLYRCRQPEQVAKSIIKPLRSLRYGRKARNKAALLKPYRLAQILRQWADR